MPGWKYAFSLSREAVKAATPPGTARLIEHSMAQHNGKYIDRVLNFPTPTADPADPLNWAPWRKFACLATVSLYAFVANFASAVVAPALPIWNASFPGNAMPFEDLTQFIAVIFAMFPFLTLLGPLEVSFNVLILGLGNIFWVPLANVFGRRPILITSALVLFVASVCGTFTSDFHRVLFIRISQGLGSSVAETIAPAIVGDMFFVHERGTWMALYTASLASGSVVGGICGGYIAARDGWFCLFTVSSALAGTAFVCAVLLAPETLYERPAPCLPAPRVPRNYRYWHRTTPVPCLTLGTLPSMHITLPSRFLGGSVHVVDPDLNFTWYSSSSSSSLSSGDLSAVAPARFSKQTRASRVTALPAVSSNIHTHIQLPPRYPAFTFLRSLRCGMYRGNLFYQFVRPWYTLRLFTTWIVMLQYGGLVGGVAVISTVGPQLLSLPPYAWGQNSGLLFLGALAGILLGAAYSTVLADQRLTAFAKRQGHGFAEPESRVPILLPSLAVATGGLLLFGFCAQYPGEYRWVGLVFAYGMVAFGLTQVPAIWFNYLIDSYAQLASDCFVMTCILRGIIPFAWTFFISQWIQSDGFLIPFGGFTVMLGVFSLLTVPLIWTGKRMRIATARFVVGNQ
ncbi:major facilitator superfamily domain-containing protein [Podospora appendiculata]|uniref:Major facilitator superfamily domain-containing protein n=1 Tax=Podospora appendiculata TaxID=314037 RepID=A0AAE1CA49_9PEZI|nr:major facilitator superfamily domain-containing protein [Podospora appendiculata]